MSTESLPPEDGKLVTLARSTRARAGATEGAAVRDIDGRTYAAATVSLPSLRLSALQLAVAMAASSGVGGLEAAALVTTEPAADDAGVQAVRDLGAAAPILVAGADAVVHSTVLP